MDNQTEKDQKELERRREDWTDGYMAAGLSNNIGGFSKEYFYAQGRRAAMKVSPDPPQPREITLSDGFKYRLENDAFWVWRYTGDGFRWILAVIHAHTLSANDLRLLADLREVSHG